MGYYHNSFAPKKLDHSQVHNNFFLDSIKIILKWVSQYPLSLSSAGFLIIPSKNPKVIHINLAALAEIFLLQTEPHFPLTLNSTLPWKEMNPLSSMILISFYANETLSILKTWKLFLDVLNSTISIPNLFSYAGYFGSPRPVTIPMTPPVNGMALSIKADLQIPDS